MVGEVKFLSPVTAQTDAEKSIAKLMFRGLVKITDANTITPDIAESYTVSDDGKTYTFKLRSNVMFSDGQPLTANDVAYTISLIQTPELKSPMYKTWASIDPEVVDPTTITLTLPNAYGPFIYNCDFGIVPSHLTSEEFAKKIVGSGPYQFVKSAKDGAKINEVDLTVNGSYYSTKPHITDLKLNIYAADTDAIKQFAMTPGANGLFGADQNQGQSLDFNSSRRLGLIFNVRKDSLKDLATRQKILSGAHLDSPINLTLTTLNLPTQQRKAEELRARFATQNINLNLNYESTAALQDKLLKKDYELLLYGFDFGFDRDPYIYWHTSQLNALNLAGFSDKKLDILMEDARMLPDQAQRNVK
ncbi:MAG: ABC transporter substrate-binding protein, partial [Methylocystaceae bacterium]|nr:ABC transporter substrate-binding protein [Methylocystaceae bacterium]